VIERSFLVTILVRDPAEETPQQSAAAIHRLLHEDIPITTAISIVSVVPADGSDPAAFALAMEAKP
jgi:hypothetical protein